MHETAYRASEKFVQKYVSVPHDSLSVLDVGSFDVNGSMKPIFSKFAKYVGLDMREGKNVDVVCNAHNMIFEDETFDVVVSSQCLEHDPMFWLTFVEMARVVKDGGFIFICSPSCGPYHPHPIDCYRFMSDGWTGLIEWAGMNKFRLTIVESYIEESCEKWRDSVAVFQKIGSQDALDHDLKDETI
jgi:ubiquinone/menaquinone biosynthesis C-methylase UbiE